MKTIPRLCVLGLALPFCANAAGLRITVQNADGEPVADAVVYVPVPNGQPQPPMKEAVIDQQDREFLPYVTAVRVGGAVSFPNNDNIRHQVYSFSPAKSFELPLYKGNPHRPIVFDKPGVVSLGCNIHDWMSAYVYVVKTPWFAVTGKDGVATLDGLPDGDYEVRVWHPRQKADAAGQKVSLGGAQPPSLSLAMEQKALVRPWRAPTALKTAGY